MPGPRFVRSPVLALTVALLVPGWAAVAMARDVPEPQPEMPVTPTDLGVTAANNSPMLLADPTDPRFVVAAHRVDSPFFGCGLQLSGDRGHGWVTAEPVPNLPPGAERCYAPEVAFDRAGVLYYLFIGLVGAGNEPMGVFLTSSADHGRTFSEPRMVLGPQNYMVRMVVDRDRASAGRMYLVWLHASQDPPLGGLPSGDNPIRAAYSDDGGHTFSAPVQVNDADRPRSVGPTVALGADGVLHVAYYDLQADARDYQGLVGPTWDGTWSVVVATSVDHGATFGAGAVVTDALAPPGRVMLIYTMAPPALATGPGGQVYVAWPDGARETDTDILLARSSDGGLTWATPVRVNDEQVARPVTQELPRIAVAPGGRVDAVFLDRRNDPEDRRFDVYYTYSTDRGVTFAPNARVTTEPSDSMIGQRYRVPSAEGLVELGSRLALLSRAGDAVVAWPDTRNAAFGTNQQDVFASRVELPDDGSGIGAGALVGAGGVAILLATGAVMWARRRVKAGADAVVALPADADADADARGDAGAGAGAGAET